MTRRIPDLMLERYALGELDATTRAEIEARVDEPEVAERLAAISASNQAVLKQMPPRVFAAAVDERVRQAAPARGMRWSVVVPVLLAAVAVLVAVPVVSQLDPGSGLEVTRAKGDPMVFLHRQGKGEPEELGEGASVAPGDLLQLSYTASGAEFGAIFSVDGRGIVTWHLPRNGRRAVRLQSGAGVPLDHSYELDDAPDFERFVFVTSPSEFDLRRIEHEVESWEAGELRLDPPLRSTLLTVSKEDAP